MILCEMKKEAGKNEKIEGKSALKVQRLRQKQKLCQPQKNAKK